MLLHLSQILFYFFKYIGLRERLGNSTVNFIFEAAIVDATNDSEETFLSEIHVPAVGNGPELGASAIDSPSDNLHATLENSRDREKAIFRSETNLNGMTT